MRIGIGLPTTVPLADQCAWACRAEAAGFSTLGAIDRLAHDCLEPLVVLAAAAAVTARIRLATTVLIAPYRLNAALLAKQAASLDALSRGRFELGVGVGVRQDDYALSGADPRRRGRELDRMVDELRRVWSGETAIGPEPIQPGGPPLVFGGTSDAAVRRVAAHGAGWICGGGGARGFRRTADKVRVAWDAAGRAGGPKLSAFVNVAVGEASTAEAPQRLREYYAFAGPYAERVVDETVLGPDAVAEAIAAHAAAGCDELIFFPATADIDEVERLAAVARPNEQGETGDHAH